MMLVSLTQKIARTAVATCLIPSVSLYAQHLSAPVSEDIVEQRLKQYKGNDTKREATLKRLFLEAGCDAAHLSEQPVPNRKQPNVICRLPGTTPATIIVGAHFDHVDAGDGIVDNWSGASLLPSLFQTLKTAPRNHTFIFIGFAGEEEGLIGSSFFVSQTEPKQLVETEAMINLDTLGLGPTEVWVSQSDPRLVNTISATAQLIHSPISGMNVNGFGDSDEESFIARKVCTLMIHTLTPATAHILHHPEDNPTAIHHSDYYESFRLLTAYLPALDHLNYPAGHTCNAKPIDNVPPGTLRPFRRGGLRR